MTDTPTTEQLDVAAALVARWTLDFDAIKDSIDEGSKRKTNQARIAWERRYASYLVARALEMQSSRSSR
jgi:hypothetical protein